MKAIIDGKTYELSSANAIHCAVRHVTIRG